MVPETKQDDDKTSTRDAKREQRTKRKKEGERQTDSGIGKSHGAPSRSGSESARLWGERGLCYTGAFISEASISIKLPPRNEFLRSSRSYPKALCTCRKYPKQHARVSRAQLHLIKECNSTGHTHIHAQLLDTLHNVALFMETELT